MSKGLVKVLIREPGEEPYIAFVELEKSGDYCDLVGGGLECKLFPNITGDMYVLCQNDGKLNNLEANILLPEYSDYLVGVIIFVGCGSQKEYLSLTDEQVEFCKNYINKNTFSIKQKTKKKDIADSDTKTNIYNVKNSQLVRMSELLVNLQEYLSTINTSKKGDIDSVNKVITLVKKDLIKIL